MSDPLACSIVVETYNLGEGTNLDRFREVLAAATETARERDGEVLVADSAPSAALERLRGDFPTVRIVPVEGCEYDDSKRVAVAAARGRYVLFLDGDCVPEPGWAGALLECLRGGSPACGGLTRYEGGFLAKVLSVMDFGFFYATEPRALECYASNNCGFLAETLEAIPVPEGALRCHCYAHAQKLKRAGRAVRLASEARVVHELPPFVRERTRQGYDRVAALWVDPDLREAGWLRWGFAALPAFYAVSVVLDWRRLWHGRRALGLNVAEAAAATVLFPFLRLPDLYGSTRALRRGPEPGGWGGLT